MKRAMKSCSAASAGSLSLLLLPLLCTACPSKTSTRSFTKVTAVQEATGALRESGGGLLLAASTGDSDAVDDEGLYELWVALDGQVASPMRVLDAAGAIEPRLLVHGLESARAAWLLPTTAGVRAGLLQSSRRDEAEAWSAIDEVENADVAEDAFDLAGNAAGAALVVWETGGSLRAALAAPGAPFAAPVTLHDAAPSDAIATPRAALAADGKALIVAHRVLAVDQVEVVAWSYDPATGFTSRGRLDASASAVTSHVVVGAARAGGFAAAWLEPNDFGAELVVRRADAAVDFLDTELIASLLDVDSRIEMAFDANDALLLAWTDVDRAQIARSPGFGDVDVLSTLFLEADDPAALQLAAGADALGTIVALESSASSGGEPKIRGTRFLADATLLTGDPVTGVRHFVSEPHDLDLIQGGPLAMAFWIVDDVLEINLWAPPHAEFTWSPSRPVAGEAVSFDAHASFSRSTNGARFLNWDFDGDGSFDDEGDRPEWTFAAPGTYAVELTVEDGRRGVAKAVEMITVGSSGGGPPWLLTVVLDGGGAVRGDRDSNGDRLLDIDCPAGGVEGCSEIYADGLITFLTPTADPGQHFVRWEGLSATFDQDFGVEGCEVVMNQDKTITAVFEAD